MVSVAFVAAGAMTAIPVFAPAAYAAPAAKLALTPNAQPEPLTFATGGARAVVTVMGLTSEQLTLDTASGTFASNCDVQMTLRDPDGNPLVGPVCAGQTGSLSVSLPVDGSYTALLVAGPSVTGSLSMEARSDGGPPSITPDAGFLDLRPNVTLGFTANAGERYSVVANGSYWIKHDSCGISFRFVDSEGNQVGSKGGFCTDGFVDATTIPADGTYGVEIKTDNWSGTGLDIALHRVTDQTGKILTNGVAVPLKLTTPGQDARLTFKGKVGNRISVLLSQVKKLDACTVSLVRPDGSVAGSVAACGRTTSGLLEPVTLDAAGTWTLRVDPTGADTGTATVARWTVVDQTGTPDLSGTPIAINLTEPGQNARYSFSGTTGQRISAYVTDATIPGHCNPLQGFSLVLVRPDGSVAAGGPNCDDPGPLTTAFVDATTLDATGTWTVVLDPVDAFTGTATLQVFNVVDQTGTADLSSTPIDLDLSAPGQRAVYSFSGTTGQRISVYDSHSTMTPNCELDLVRPDGSNAQTVSCGGANVFIEPFPLDATGTWSVVVDPQGPITGTAKLQIASVVDQSGTITPNGAAVAVAISTPGQNASYTFSGTTGDSRTIAITGSTYPGCSSMFVSLLRPDSTKLAFKGTCTASLTIGPVSLDATGTWTIVVDPQGGGTGTATMKLT